MGLLGCCKMVQPAKAACRHIARETRMRPLQKTGLLIHLQQNKAGLIADLAILALFLLLLAVR